MPRRSRVMRKTRVLIVDDDESVCREIADWLVLHGMDASWSSSLEPHRMQADDTLDVVVLDLGMPGTDGFQIIDALAAIDYPPAVVVASGQDQRIIRAAVQSAVAAGLPVLGSLEKPFPPEALLALIGNRQRPLLAKAIDPVAAVRILAASGRLMGNLRTAFQSKRRLADSAIIGYEALLRLTIGNVPINPEIVFSSALDSATRLMATGVILNDALRFASQLSDAGRPVPVAVNCTPNILCDPAFHAMVEAALATWKLPPRTLLIEITEHETATSFAELAAAASRLAMRDCGIGVDDFGRGAASFERMTELPLIELKIDKAVFWQCVDGEVPMAMLEQIIQYCRQRNILSVIEGIETQTHLDRAIAAGAQGGQGYFWDRPALVPLQDGVLPT